MIIKGSTIILTDDQAASYYGDDWVDSLPLICGGPIFFDGHEVTVELVKDGVFDRLELTAVHNIDFERVYS